MNVNELPSSFEVGEQRFSLSADLGNDQDRTILPYIYITIKISDHKDVSLRRVNNKCRSSFDIFCPLMGEVLCFCYKQKKKKKEGADIIAKR